MSSDPYSSFHPQKPPKFAEAMLRLAEAHASGLRQAFHEVAAMRPDAPTWGRLEQACAQMLERRHARASQKNLNDVSPWLSFDERTERAVEDLLNRVSNNEAAESYLRSVNELLHNTAHWTYIFDTTTAAYWRHASLVWLSLWHAALAPTVTATQAAVCVGLTARRKKAAPSVRKNTLPARLRQKLKLLSFSILKRDRTAPGRARNQ
jgi:hypothetical protein